MCWFDYLSSEEYAGDPTLCIRWISPKTTQLRQKYYLAYWKANTIEWLAKHEVFIVFWVGIYTSLCASQLIHQDKLMISIMKSLDLTGFGVSAKINFIYYDVKWSIKALIYFLIIGWKSLLLQSFGLNILQMFFIKVEIKAKESLLDPLSRYQRTESQWIEVFKSSTF